MEAERFIVKIQLPLVKKPLLILVVIVNNAGFAWDGVIHKVCMSPSTQSEFSKPRWKSPPAIPS